MENFRGMRSALGNYIRFTSTAKIGIRESIATCSIRQIAIISHLAEVCVRIQRGVLFATLCCSISVAAADLANPVRLKAGTEFIDTELGHAAPFMADFDGDGIRDLLVGQLGGGKLKIYRNIGSNKKPDYAPANSFHTSGEVINVPTS
jgi:hypothetical protein